MNTSERYQTICASCNKEHFLSKKYDHEFTSDNSICVEPYIDPDNRETSYDLGNMQSFYRSYNHSYVKREERKERIHSLLNSIKRSWLVLIVTFVIAQTIMFAAWYFVIEIGWRK